MTIDELKRKQIEKWIDHKALLIDGKRNIIVSVALGDTWNEAFKLGQNNNQIIRSSTIFVPNDFNEQQIRADESLCDCKNGNKLCCSLCIEKIVQKRLKDVEKTIDEMMKEISNSIKGWETYQMCKITDKSKIILLIQTDAKLEVLEELKSKIKGDKK